MPKPTLGPVKDDFPRQDYTVTNIHGLPVYIDEQGRKCPTVSGIIQRMKSKGQINPPIYSTDGYERTANDPERIWWYSRLLGELAHDRIADRLDETYQRDLHGIARRIRQCTGIDADELDVVGELYQFRGGNIRSRLLKQAEKDVKSILAAWEWWWGNIQRSLEPVRAELRIIREDPVRDARWGIRPDLIAVDNRDEEIIGVCIKTTHEITNAHRVQAVATLYASPYFDRVVIVRLDGEYERAETEEVDFEELEDPDSPFFGLPTSFGKEAVKAYRSVN